MDDEAITAKFQQALPHAALNVAPGLAARYVSRARLRSPACSFPDSCPKCGTYLFDGSGQIRVVRLKKRKDKEKAQRVLRRTCLVCGHNSNTALHKEADPPKSGQAQKLASEVDLQHATNSKPPSPPHETPPRPVSVHPMTLASRHRGKHIVKAGLQELLSRNKARTTHPEDKEDTSLAAFLKGL